MMAKTSGIASHPTKRAGLTIALFLISVLSGCSQMSMTMLPNEETAVLEAADLVCILHRADFTNEQIIEIGPELRNALATQGAVQIRLAKKTKALLVVRYPYVYVSTHQRGSFCYNLQTREIR